jgi:hypothetical protein
MACVWVGEQFFFEWLFIILPTDFEVKSDEFYDAAYVVL